MPRSERARLMDLVKLRGVVDVSRRSVPEILLVLFDSYEPLSALCSNSEGNSMVFMGDAPHREVKGARLGIVDETGLEHHNVYARCMT